MSQFTIPSDFFSVNMQPRGTRVAFVDENNQIVKEIRYQDEPNAGTTNVIKVVNNTYVVTHDGASFAYAQNYATVNLNNFGQVSSEVYHKGLDSVELYYFQGAGSLKSLPNGLFEIPKVSLIVEHKEGQYDDQRAFDLLGNLSARQFNSLSNNLSLVATHDSISNTFKETLVRSNGSQLIASGGGNINKLISQDGGGLISQDGGGLIAAGGGNLISQDGGSLKLDNIRGVISNDGGGLISTVGKSIAPVLSHDGASLSNQLFALRDGSGLVAAGAGNFTGALRSLQSLKEGEVGDTTPAPVTPSDDFRDNADGIGPGVLGSVTVNGAPVAGNLEILEDRDWFAVNLTAGTSYTIELKGADTGDGTMIDPALRLYNNSVNLGKNPPTIGVLIASNDDSGNNHNARLIFTATYSGTYYLEAGSATQSRIENNQGHDYAVSSGTYKLSVATANTTPYFYAQNHTETPEASRSTTVAENTPSTATLLTARGYDAVTGSSGLTYSIAGGQDADKFFIGPTNGVLGFSSGFTPDYERPADSDGDNIYKLVLKVTDATGLSSTQDISVLISDVNEPVFTFPNNPSRVTTLNVAENSGNLITYLEAFEPAGAGYSLSYTLEGPDALRFSLGPQGNGRYLYWQTGINPDYETPRDVGLDNRYEVTVKAENTTTHLYDRMSYIINVTDQPDPAVNDLSYSQVVNDTEVKNPFAGATIANATSATVSLSTLANGSFTAASLSSSGFQSIGSGVWSRTGTAADLTTAMRALVYDPNDIQTALSQPLTTSFTVTVKDANNITATKSATLLINDTPVIISDGGGSAASKSIAENTTAVTTVQATDFDAGAHKTYSIVPGHFDAAKFSINASTGVLVFISAPDFENPQGFSGNTYGVDVQVSDGLATDVQTLFVTVTDVVETAPEITVLGNAVSIADGDTTPSSTDLTDFGAATQNGTAVVRTFTVKNDGNATLTTSGLTVPTGFTVVEGLSASIAAGASDTFQVRLDTGTIGTKSGQISFTNNDSNENPFNFSITGKVNASVTAPVRHDFDGNSHSDILWHNDNGADSIWDNGQIGGAHGIAAAGVVPASWHIAGKADFDGNGRGDILWQNDNGAISIWDNGQIGSAHIVSAANVVPNSWHIAGTGDFDGNHHDDILWRNDNGAVSIWDNGQIGGAHLISAAGVVPNSWHIAGTGDFNGDGSSDVLWRNDNGAASIWDSGQIGGAHVIAAQGIIPGGWNIAGTGDFDGNHHDDILWRNDNGAVSIWDDGQIGGAHLVSAAGVVPNSWHIADTGDFDGNGHSDILWRNDNGAASIWDNGAIGGAHMIANPGDIPAGWHIV
ncbi:MAG: serralysin [Bradyrhizobium sp.]|jgi:hypothetical protein|nr:serralysin [Bradyrhizobium sp.]